ncbi:hypothetical protein ACVIKP_001849 [Rhizobium leguminosarum]
MRSRSPSLMLPLLGCRKPATRRNVVVFPQPLEPSRDTSSPAMTEIDRSLSTWVLP